MEILSQGGGLVIAQQFGDSDVFTDHVRGWELDFRQLDCGEFHSTLKQVITPSLLLTECSMSRQMEQHGGVPAGFHTFAVPVHDSMRVRWRDGYHCGEELMLFKPGSELDSVSEPGFHVFTVSISDRLLAPVASRHGFASIEALCGRPDVFRCAPQVQRRLRKLIQGILATATENPGIVADPRFVGYLEHELVESIVDALLSSQAAQHRPMARSRSTALRTAVGLISEHAKEPITVNVLEEQSGVTARTLRNAFQEAFGVSPKQYLQAFRLNAVRRQLQQGASGRLVIADVANDWGFWHMGQFAADYRRMFGELPSATLGRAPD